MTHPLAAIVGPTAVGKTQLSLDLAKALNGEIISCDSMQIYRAMDIGTAKATEAERSEAVHHLIDICDPTENFSVVDYQKLAYEKIAEIADRGHLPILVGGTGLFYQAVVDGYEFSAEAKAPELREKWTAFYELHGQERLMEELRKWDPVYADKIGVNDTKRALHALEVSEALGRPFSESIAKNDTDYSIIPIGLYRERSLLYERINLRVESMMKEGLIEEIVRLKEMGLTRSCQSAQAIGYKQGLSYLEGEMTLEEMVDSIQRESRKYAKRQYTWFKKDSRIFWLNTASGLKEREMSRLLTDYVWKRIDILKEENGGRA